MLKPFEQQFARIVLRENVLLELVMTICDFGYSLNDQEVLFHVGLQLRGRRGDRSTTRESEAQLDLHVAILPRGLEFEVTPLL